MNDYDTESAQAHQQELEHQQWLEDEKAQAEYKEWLDSQEDKK
jgi:hypothetical protein